MKQSIDFKGQSSSEAIGISKHNVRNEKFNISNENIDKTRSKKNVILKANRVLQISNQIGELSRKKLIAGGLQDKSHVFTSFVIQSGSKEDHLTDEKALEYFKGSLAFLEEKFGKSKIAQATIHFDETTPHLHVIVSNLKKKKGTKKYFCSTNRSWGWEKLKTKTEVRKSAKEFEQSFYKKVSSKFGFEAPMKELGKKGKQSKELWKALERVRKFENAKEKPDKNSEALTKKLVEMEEKNKELSEAMIGSVKLQRFFESRNIELESELKEEKAKNSNGKGFYRQKGPF